MIKRILSVFLLLAMIIGVVPVYSASSQQTAEDRNLAYFFVNEKGRIESSNMALIETEPNVAPNMVERDGKKGIWIAHTGGDKITNLYLSIAEDFAFKVEDGTEFVVEIDYYAMDTSIFYCLYDSLNDRQKGAGLGQYLIGVDDVYQWKTMTFNLSDAYFGDRLGPAEREQYDLNINTGSNGSILVNAVRVKKIPQQNKLYVTGLNTVNVGNIFGDNEEQKFYFDVVNTTNKTQSAELLYRVVTEDGLQTIWSGKGEVTVEPYRTKRVEAIADCKRFGIFHLEASIKGESFEQKDFVPFSHVDVIEDGTKNKKFGWCQVFATQFDADEQIALAERTNAGYVRGPGMGWNDVVTKSGSNIKYEIPEKDLYIMRKLADKGFSFLINIGCVGNEIFDGVGGNRMPVEKELREPYLEFIDFIAKELKKENVDIIGWEFWNEPNLKKFNTNMANGTEYGELAKDVAAKVHEYFPGISFYTGSLTSLNAQVTKDYYQDLLDTGIGDTTNGIALHTYSHTVVPEIGLVKEVKEYIEKYEEHYGRKPRMTNSELGYVTQPSVSGSLVKTDLELAKFNTRMYIFYTANKLFDEYAWYMLSDSGTNKKSMEHVFGQTEVGWVGLGGKQRLAAKESFVALTFMNKALQNADVEKTVSDKDDTYAFIFRRPKDNAMVMPVWTPYDARIFSFKCDAESLTLYDMYGNPETIYGHNGVFSISATDAVQYIEGNLNNIEVVYNPVNLSAEDIIAAVDNEMSLSLIASNHEGLTAELSSTSPDFAIVEGKSEFTDAGAVVSFRTSSRKGAKTDLTINVKDGDKLIYKWQIPVELSDEVSLLATTGASGSVDVWGMDVKLNNHSTVPMTGTISVVSPPELAQSYEPVDFDTIPAGKTAKIEFKPQKLERVGLYPAVFRVETKSGKTFDIAKNLDFSVANYATVKPKIDGYINEDEWNFGSKLSTIYEEQVKFGALYPWGGVNDLSSETMIKYDEDNFYMAVIAKDDTHVSLPVGVGAGNIWMYDSMQFGISFEHYMTDDVVGGTFTEITFGETYDGTWVYRGMSELNNLPTKQLTNDVVKCEVRREGSYTYYEICIPWSEITVKDIDFDKLGELTFSMLINDNDGAGRKGWMEYGSGIGSRKDVSLFSALQLVK